MVCVTQAPDDVRLREHIACFLCVYLCVLGGVVMSCSASSSVALFSRPPVGAEP